jgi:hypothetical protein
MRSGLRSVIAHLSADLGFPDSPCFNLLVDRNGQLPKTVLITQQIDFFFLKLIKKKFQISFQLEIFALSTWTYR